MADGNPRILVAEDSPILQHIVMKQLRSCGVTSVDTAENGNIAVQKAINTSYDLIFMDVMMPELDGFSAVMQIRTHEQNIGRHVTIVAMTGWVDREKCLQIGMDDFLQKPVLLEPLKSVLGKWLYGVIQEPSVGSIVQSGKTDINEHRSHKVESQIEPITSRIGELRKRFGLEA
jgi:CheY-like chemotaxis protein